MVIQPYEANPTHRAKLSAAGNLEWNGTLTQYFTHSIIKPLLVTGTITLIKVLSTRKDKGEKYAGKYY